jgi:hypothetical protein
MIRGAKGDVVPRELCRRAGFLLVAGAGLLVTGLWYA